MTAVPGALAPPVAATPPLSGPALLAALNRYRWLVAFTVAVVVVSVVGTDFHYKYLFQLTVAGLGIGSIAALSGLGLVLTYRATGVFNFAQGGVSTIVVYVLYELDGRGLPIWLAAPIALLVAGPALGLLLEGAVFRPLQRRGAGTSEKLVANLGVLVLLVGIPTLGYGLVTRNAPLVVPNRGRPIFGVSVGYTTLVAIGLVIASGVGLTLLFRLTRLGVQIRAVVDRRTLAELMAVNANRVSQVAWVLGCTFAGVVGVLYAPTAGLSPFQLTLTVLETIAVAAIAKLRSLGLAVAGGLLIGVLQTLMQAVFANPLNGVPHLPDFLTGIPVNLLVVSLVVFLLIYRDLDEVGSAGAGLVTSAFGRRERSRARRVAPPLVGAAIVLLPLGLLPQDISTPQAILAYTVAFLAVVTITGFSGNITLATAAFAALGAYSTARLQNGYLPLPIGRDVLPHIPVLAAMLISAVLVVPLGILIGYPALRRRGLILGLLTLAFAQLVDRLILNNPLWVAQGLGTKRPHLGPVNLDGERVFYLFELVVLGVALLLARNLRSGALGRALGAMRDSETGATSVGISLRRYKLFIFGASAFLAALGGELIAQQSRAFNLEGTGPFSPLQGLFWFAAVVVAGLSYLSGAAIAATLYVGVDALTGTVGSSTFVIGLLASQIGYLRGGLVGTALRLASGDRLLAGLRAHYEAHLDAVPDEVVQRPAVLRQPTAPSRPAPPGGETAPGAEHAPAVIGQGLAPSDFALRIFTGSAR